MQPHSPFSGGGILSVKPQRGCVQGPEKNEVFEPTSFTTGKEEGKIWGKVCPFPLRQGLLFVLV